MPFSLRTNLQSPADIQKFMVCYLSRCTGDQRRQLLDTLFERVTQMVESFPTGGYTLEQAILEEKAALQELQVKLFVTR
jgi:hypothetical protein